MGVRLPAGQLTAVLGPPVVRRRLMALLDDTGVCRLDAASAGVGVNGGTDGGAAARVRLVDDLRAAPPALVLVDRVTDGLDAADRRRVLQALRALAASGPAVLVDDADAVAALAVADHTLCADPIRGLTVEAVAGRDLAALVP